MTTKKQTKRFVFATVTDKRSLFTLPDGTRLEWVPSWEGVLLFAPADIAADRPPRIWHTFRSKRFGGRRVRIELKPMLERYADSRNRQRPRVRFHFLFKGRDKLLYRSHLTWLCYTGFKLEDPGHNVIDHDNEITIDDRPSNLQAISQLENSRRSKRYWENQKLNNRARKLAAEQRAQWMSERRKLLIGIMPEADAIDIELELAMQVKEEYDNQVTVNN